MNSVQIIPARKEDLGEIQELLKSADLPWQDVAEHLSDFLVARSGESIIGAVGLEISGTGALLRSLVVQPAVRRTGVGNALYRRILDQARRRGIREVGLLTTTAEGFFLKAGFEKHDKGQVPDFVRTSREFRELCPSSAVYMRMIIQ
ncbi:MAG: GNAT family N-acetyltransferase [Ignavibacteriales bacterium]|nr:GNAT family N-acetyltransferase [Ignavibacteriales bacterium]